MGKIWRHHRVGDRSAPWTETATSLLLLSQAWNQKKLPLWAGSAASEGKETWEFSNRVPRYPFWCRQLFGYAPRDPGSYQTWTQVVPWATAKRRAKPGASVSLSFLRTAGVAGTSMRTSVPRRQTTPHHTCCPCESGWWLGGGESGFRKQAQSTVSRKPSRLRRLI